MEAFDIILPPIGGRFKYDGDDERSRLVSTVTSLTAALKESESKEIALRRLLLAVLAENGNSVKISSKSIVSFNTNDLIRTEADMRDNSVTVYVVENTTHYPERRESND